MTKIELLQTQEQLLWFPHFTHDDAWELGCFMKDMAAQQKLSIAMSIRMDSGLLLFQYIPDTSGVQSQDWMLRKYNTALHMDKSSLLALEILKSKDQILEDHGLDRKVAVLCGGAFPIRVSGVGKVGAVVVSALPHECDHEFIVGCLALYLHRENVPRLDVPMDLR